MGAVYAMDLLGFGSSQKPEGVTYDPHLWKDQVVDFVNTLVPEPCVLLGNSIGSQVGQSFLEQRGHRIPGREAHSMEKQQMIHAGGRSLASSVNWARDAQAGTCLAAFMLRSLPGSSASLTGTIEPPAQACWWCRPQRHHRAGQSWLFQIDCICRRGCQSSKHWHHSSTQAHWLTCRVHSFFWAPQARSVRCWNRACSTLPLCYARRALVLTSLRCKRLVDQQVSKPERLALQ